MPDRPDDGDLGRFVADERPGLLRAAVLLTGDRTTAEELVQRALSRTRRAAPATRLTAARRALVQGVTGWRARLPRGGAQVVEALPDPFAPAPTPGDPTLAGALRELPGRTRAAAVLSVVDGLDAAALAPLLGTDPAEAATLAADGTAALQAALTPDPYRRQQPAEPAQLLREQLLRLAAADSRWRLDAPQATADVAHRRSRSHRRVLAAAAVAVVCGTGAVVTVTRPDVVPTAASPAETATDAPTDATTDEPESGQPAGPVRSVPVLTGPTRGSLAGDTAFLDAVRQTGWGGLEPPPPAERTVVLATDTPDGRAVLVVGTVTEDFRGVWLTGPVGAAPDQLTPHVPPQLGRDRPITLLLGGPGQATLVVVAAPGDAVEVSERLMAGPRGTVGRTWAPAEATDGVAVVPARTTEDGPALSVRVSRDGRLVHRSGVDWPGDRPGRTVPLPVLTPVRPGSTPADSTVVDAALVALAVPLGAEPADLGPELLWSGTLPLSTGPGTVAVVAVESPGGARVVSTWAGSRGGALPCGTQTPPGSTLLESVTIARVCEVDLPGLGPPRDSAWLVVSAPPTVATAELLGIDGRVLGPLPLSAGSAVVPLPVDARTVRTSFPNGAVAAETPIAPPARERFGDFGPGTVR